MDLKVVGIGSDGMIKRIRHHRIKRQPLSLQQASAAWYDLQVFGFSCRRRRNNKQGIGHWSLAAVGRGIHYTIPHHHGRGAAAVQINALMRAQTQHKIGQFSERHTAAPAGLAAVHHHEEQFCAILVKTGGGTGMADMGDASAAFGRHARLDAHPAVFDDPRQAAEEFPDSIPDAEQSDKNPDRVASGEILPQECRRILRPEGVVMLVWNDRVDASSPFMEAYEQFLQEYSTDYQQIDLRLIDAAQLDRFFGAGSYRTVAFENVQHFDLEGLAGRYRSCSYALPPHHSQYAAAMHQLGVLFRQYAVNDSVEMVYRTIAYWR